MSLKEKIASLPQKSGCYLMKNEYGEVIYVGKAKILANRVKSYFVGSHNAKTTALVSHITDFEYIITKNEKEAFILEMNLIKKYNPKYNILLTDDKSYPYILITSEKDPRILYTRDLSKKGKYYGPYPSVSEARETFELLNKIYPLRKCNSVPKKECLYYHIGECLAPCINNVNKEKYEEIKQKITSFLAGNAKKEIDYYEKLMIEASDALDYEKANEYLKLINSIKTSIEKQNVTLGKCDIDIFSLFEKNEFSSIQVFHLRDGKMVERRAFLFENEKYDDLLVSFIGQFYLVLNNPLPKEIIIPDVNIEILPEEIKKIITIPKRGQKKDLLDMAFNNAKEKIDTLLQKENIKQKRTKEAVEKLGNLLNINTPNNIEAFDNSNIQGVNSVSGMVSFIDGVKNPKGYRKFLVKTVVGANDALTMYEVVKRRYKRLKDENKTFPDLIIMDGAKMQVNSAKKALNELNVNIPIMGLIKDQNHNTDKILYEDDEYIIDKKSDLFYFLENVQDEVHRFAISFFRKNHEKNSLSSLIDNIKGIGKVKRNQIISIIGKNNFKEEFEKLKLSEMQKAEIRKILNF